MILAAVEVSVGGVTVQMFPTTTVNQPAVHVRLSGSDLVEANVDDGFAR